MCPHCRGGGATRGAACAAIAVRDATPRGGSGSTSERSRPSGHPAADASSRQRSRRRETAGAAAARSSARRERTRGSCGPPSPRRAATCRLTRVGRLQSRVISPAHSRRIEAHRGSSGLIRAHPRLVRFQSQQVETPNG